MVEEIFDLDMNMIIQNSSSFQLQAQLSQIKFCLTLATRITRRKMATKAILFLILIRIDVIDNFCDDNRSIYLSFDGKRLDSRCSTVFAARNTKDKAADLF